MPSIRTCPPPVPRPVRPALSTAVPRPRASAALLAALALAACGGRDPFAPNPDNNVDTFERTFVVYPLSTATGARPSAVDLAGQLALRPGIVAVGAAGVPTPNFDFAVDRAANGAPNGEVRLLPPRLVADPGAIGRRPSTVFQLTNVPFDSIAEATTSGYGSDSVATTVTVGQSVIVRTESLVCVSRYSSQLYAKLLVESVDPATGAVTLRGRINPNCGFRSLRPGRG